MLTHSQRPTKSLPAWSVAERTRLLELYTRGDILWDTRAEELDREFGKNHPPNFFTVQSVKYELHLIFRDPNPEHVNTGLPSHPRGKEAAEMWLKHYRKKLAEKQEQAKQMLKIGMRKTLDLVLRFKNGQMPMVELMAMRDQQRQQDAERPDAEKFEKNLQKFMSQSHAEDLDYVTCLEDLLKVIKGDRLQPSTPSLASPLRSPKMHPLSPPSIKSTHQVSSAASSPITQPSTPKQDHGVSLAEKLGFSPPNRSPVIKASTIAVSSPLRAVTSPLRSEESTQPDSGIDEQKPRGIDLPVGMGYRTPVSHTPVVDNVQSGEDEALDVKAKKITEPGNSVKQMEAVKLDSPPSSGLRQRPSSFSPSQSTLQSIASPVTTKKSEVRKASATLRGRNRILISEDEDEPSETKELTSIKKSIKSPTRSSKAAMETEEDTTDQDSTDTTASTNQKDKSSLKRRLRTTATINTPSTSTPVAKEVFEASIDAGPSRKRGRTAETSDVSANDLVDAPPSKNLRRTHGSPPIAITGIQLKQAAAEMAALIQSPSSETAAEKDNNKRRASTRIQVLQRVPSGSESAVTSAAAATPPAKHPVIDVDEEVISVVADEHEKPPKHEKVKKEVLQEEKSISSATIAFKQEAEKEDEKSLWHREKNGKGSFSIGTQTNVSVRHLCVPIQPITLKCKQTRGRIAPKLPLSMGTQTEKVEFGAEDVLYIRPIGSTQTYKHVDKAVSLEEQKASFAKKSKAKPATVTTDEDTIAQIAMENEKLAFLDSHTTSTAENLQKASAHKMTGKESSRSRNTKDSSVISQTSIQHSQSSAVSEIKVVISQRPQSPSKKDKKSMGDAKTLRGSSARPVRAQAPVAAAAVTKTILIALWKEIIAMRNAPIFTQPVSDEDVPGYNSVVKRPMDLSTIRRKIDSGSICTINEFREHILLMFTNAIMFNSTEHDINQIAKDMLRFCLKLIRDAQYAAGEFGDVSPPVKTSRRSQAVTGKLESRPRASPSVDRERAGSVASEASFIAPPPVHTPAAVKLTGSSSSSSAVRFKSRLGTRPTLFLNEEEEREANEKEAKKHLLPRKTSISAVQKVRQNTSK